MKARLALLALSCMSPMTAPAVEPITVAWRNKAPYHYMENGVEHGFLLERAKGLFAAAGVPAVFIEQPSKRIWHSFEQGKQAYCSIGWYRLPERERLAQFSLAFHVDPPHLLLVGSAALATIRSHASFAALLADNSLTLGVVDGVSYGPALDRLIQHSTNRIERATVEPASMMRMVAANRVAYMLADQADWQYQRSRQHDWAGIAEYHFNDMPPGLERFIVCSKDVSADAMARLNQAITELAMPAYSP
ncbi:MAG: transporter substrate-binding domain-containing protein [Pseudomonadota bacterium]